MMNAKSELVEQAGAQLEAPRDFNNSDNPITAIARIAASGAGKEVVEQMMALVEWDDKRRAVANFNAAFSNAKQKFKKAKKSGKNTHLKTHYSLLEDYDEATRDALSEFGLSWRHVVSTDGDMTHVKCILAHKDGHSEACELEAPSYSMTNNAVNKLQSLGIVVMYLKRITLSSMLGIVSSEFDNDGNGGGVERITPEQVTFLAGRLDSTKSNKKAFLAHFKLDALEDMPAAVYEDAVRVIKQKEERMKAEANAKAKA